MSYSYASDSHSGYYPQLIGLYQSLGVAFRQADFSYSFSLFSPSTKQACRKITTTMIYNGASGREGVSMPSMMNDAYLNTKGNSMLVRTQTRIATLALFILVTMQVVYNYLRLIFLSVPFLRPAGSEKKTFREWTLDAVPRGVLARWSGMDVSWANFTREVLVPLFSAVCTASEVDIMDHPMEEFLGNVVLSVVRKRHCLPVCATRLYMANVRHAPLRCDKWRQRRRVAIDVWHSTYPSIFANIRHPC